VMRQSGGRVTVESGQGEGTSVRLHFPAASSHLRRPVSDVPMSSGPSVSVLVVEDEAQVRRIIVRTLLTEGHQVVEAEDVASGLAAIADFQGELGLLVTDGIMPGRPVGELVEGYRLAHPRGKVLVCSGYLADASIKRVVEGGGAAFLAKPVRARQLARVVAELLRGRIGSAPDPAASEPES
jgi:DNA-binding NtrC family response regulator